MRITDESIMPFGKYKGIPIGEVPASYLLWFADKTTSGFMDIRTYIEEKREQLEAEKEE